MENEKKSFPVEYLLTIVTRMSFTVNTEDWFEVMRFMTKQPEPLRIHPIQRDWLMDLCRENLVKQLPWLEKPWIMETVKEIDACFSFAIKKLKAKVLLGKVRARHGKDAWAKQIPGNTVIPGYFSLMEQAGIKVAFLILPPQISDE
jgi:hypothetical protein